MEGDMSIENIFLNRINELGGMGLSDVLLDCVDKIEELTLVLDSSDATAEALLAFRKQDGEKLSKDYCLGYQVGHKAKLLGLTVRDMPYLHADTEDKFWGWFDAWVDTKKI